MQTWFEKNVLALAREMRWSFLPPLMVYVAAGISGLTAIVGTFFVKDQLGLSAEFLTALGFWAGLPWALKMPIGHLVDLIWRWKGLLVYLGASLIALSILIMVGLLSDPTMMRQYAHAETWYVLAALLAPIGYVTQDVVADAMTVEAVPLVDDQGKVIDAAVRRSMHTTMQTLGRIAIIGGGLLVSLLNVFMLRGIQNLPKPQQQSTYVAIYELALIIPIVSILGVILASWLQRRQRRQLMATGLDAREAARRLMQHFERPAVNWWILGGGLAFAATSIAIGLANFKFGQEIIFAISMTVILIMLWRLLREMDASARNTLLGTAIVIFVFRALPGPGPGQTWWMIDSLKFDQQFLSELSLIGAALTLFGLFIFRSFMAERSIYSVVTVLTIVGTVFALPIIGMYFGLHHWTAALTGGVVDARFIALVDTALESPLGQVAMVPMLAWIANSAPDKLKATYFAVMASFTNLALSASQLGSKYLNQFFVVKREVKDAATGAIKTAADYSQLGDLMIAVAVIGLAVPLITVALLRMARLRSA